MSSSNSDNDSDAAKNNTPRGTCWICDKPTKNPEAKQHKGCRKQKTKEKKELKKMKKKAAKKAAKKKRKKEEEMAKEKAAKAAKARRKLKKQKEEASAVAKKRKREDEDADDESEEEEEEERKKSSKTGNKTGKKSGKQSKSGKSKPPASKKAKAQPAAAPAPAAGKGGVAVFKVEKYNKVSSPDLQVLDGDDWRYVSIHVHKKDSHVIIWYGKQEYEGLGLRKGHRYSMEGLPPGDMFTGANATLLDGDGDGIDCRRGPPKPLPTFTLDKYNKVSAENFQVKSMKPGEWNDCVLFQCKEEDDQHCELFIEDEFFV